MPCNFCVLRERSLVFLSLLGVLQMNSILNLVFFFLDFSFFAGVPGWPKYRTKNENRKTPKTRRKRPSFRNGIGTVPGVYEATTIAHRTPLTMVGGTRGVFKTSFWPNIASALPNKNWMGS